jgi:hypothetical protein
MLRRIVHELRHHITFTLGGALAGVALMVAMVYWQASSSVSETLFEVFHPAHVFLSALATTAMYRRYARGTLWATVLVGYVGAVGIATLSDCVIPFLGETLLQLPHAHIHAGFIEEWYIVNPAALAGIGVAYLWPDTHWPHAGHVLLSTAASLFHMTLAVGGTLTAAMAATLGAFLFLAVWLPCCTSDILFPLLLVGRDQWPACAGCGRAVGGDKHHHNHDPTDDHDES